MNEVFPFRSATAKQQFLRLYDSRAARWPVSAETRMLTTTQGRTLVRASGPADAAPLVLLHGIGGSSLQWHANVESLSRRNRVYAVDALYDRGRSIETRSLDGVDDYTHWLDELLVGLDLRDTASLVGLSYGGWLAAQYALRHPKRVRRLVLIAPVGTVLPLSAGWIARAILAALPFASFTRRFLFWLAADLAGRDEEGRRIVEEWAQDAFVAQRSFRRRRIAHPTVLSDAEWNELSMPVLFLVGENEKIYSAAAAASRLRQVAPHVSVEVLPGAGHDLSVVQADRVNDCVDRFLNASPEATAALPGDGAPRA